METCQSKTRMSYLRCNRHRNQPKRDKKVRGKTKCVQMFLKKERQRKKKAKCVRVRCQIKDHTKTVILTQDMVFQRSEMWKWRGSRKVTFFPQIQNKIRTRAGEPSFKRTRMIEQGHNLGGRCSYLPVDDEFGWVQRVEGRRAYDLPAGTF